MRDDFPAPTKELLAKRVGYRCSNPSCRQLTTGPHNEQSRSVNIGVAAHITAASPGGPRFDASLSPDQRKLADNGIWLCHKCAKLIDSDVRKYTVDILSNWKKMSEQYTANELDSRVNVHSVTQKVSVDIFLKKIEAYQALYYAVQKASSLIREIFDATDISVGNKQAMISEIILQLANITDENSFYLDHEISIHAVGSFIGVDDILTIEDINQRKKEMDRFNKNVRNTYRLIEHFRDTGQIDGSINSPIIRLYRERRQQQDIDDQKI